MNFPADLVNFPADLVSFPPDLVSGEFSAGFGEFPAGSGRDFPPDLSEMLSAVAAQTFPTTRAGGQHDGSQTNSLKLALLHKGS